MKIKTILQTIAILFIINASKVYAEVCPYVGSSLPFSTAIIENYGVNCEYTDSLLNRDKICFTVYGKYEPVNANWTRNKENKFECKQSISDCNFQSKK